MHTGLVGEAPSWAKTVVVGALFAGVVAALAAAYYRRLYAAWRARVNAWFVALRQQQAEAAAAQEAAAAPGLDPWEEEADEGHPEVRPRRRLSVEEFKALDNRALARYNRIQAANQAFDAEVGVSKAWGNLLHHYSKQKSELSSSPSLPLPSEVLQDISILPPGTFGLQDRNLWCTPRLCIDPFHADPGQLKKKGLRPDDLWNEGRMFIEKGNLIKIGVEVQFNLPQKGLSSSTKEALYFHAYKETIWTFETMQDLLSLSTPWGRIGWTSGFSLEDLPSNYVAYLRYRNPRLTLQDIADMMGGVQGAIPYQDWERIRGRLPKNKDKYMRPLVYSNGQWHIINWPQEIAPPVFPASEIAPSAWVKKRSIYLRVQTGKLDFKIINIPLFSAP
ncbi:MAG: hypothetical protein GXO56_06405 [Chloroflexi bacterium]|nr:hypothetical protein [Chloroflexota bacterium]